MDRPLTGREHAVLEWMLQDDFEGVEAYRAQIASLRVRGVCGCGCPTIDFVTDPSGVGNELPRMGWLPNSPVAITLYARDGVLTMLDLTDFVDATTEFPDPADLVDYPPK